MVENYDSFSYNIVQCFADLDRPVKVVQNDEIDVKALKSYYASIILSPGPCTPERAGRTLDVIATCYKTHPMLGICLGHQAIGQYFGGKVTAARKPVHGKKTPIYHDGSGVFASAPNPIVAVRYNSLVVDRDSVPGCLHINAWTETDDGAVDEVMGLRHVDLPIHSVQFHPESIASTHGYLLLTNWLNLIDG